MSLRPFRPSFPDAIPFVQLPPQNLAAEMSVLGSLLLDNAAIDDVAAFLKAEDFYRDSHQILFARIVEIRSAGSPVDAILLIDELTRRGEFEKVGGDETIRNILEATASSANAVYHGQIVRQRAVARRLIEAANQILRDGYSDNFTCDELIEHAESAVFAIGESEASGDTADLGEALVEAGETISRRMAGEFSGITSRFEEIDYLLGGFQPGTLTIVAARPSMGKTAFALNVCDHVAVDLGITPYVVSLEMNRSEIAMRLLQSRAGVDSHKLKNPRYLTADERDRLAEAHATLAAHSFPLDDTPGRTVVQIAANARRLKARRGIGLVVIDYLQMIDGDSDKPRHEQVAAISKRLKQLARELSVPVIALSQLNRAAENREDRRPRMSDLRESGAIEQDADAVILLHRPEYYDPNDQPGVAEAIIAKNRNGGVGTVKLCFVKHLARFDSLQPDFG